jgi:hypothetical protein
MADRIASLFPRDFFLANYFKLNIVINASVITNQKSRGGKRFGQRVR